MRKRGEKEKEKEKEDEEEEEKNETCLDRMVVAAVVATILFSIYVSMRSDGGK